jgi:hypothetical protein
MKFEVELIEGGRCIIPTVGNFALVVTDDELAAVLRVRESEELAGANQKPIKTRKPHKPRVRKALGKGIEGGQNSDA